MKNNIINIIKICQDKFLKKKYNKLFEKIISNFILKNKLIIYGGIALNLLLPKNKKIYKSYSSADYDCYSYNAKKNIYKLAKIFKKLGCKMIKIRLALHENTYKLFIGENSIIDITEISKNLYDSFLKIHKEEIKTKIYKYYKKKYIIVPIALLKRNLYYELSRPESSFYRWEKIYNRINLLNKITKITKIKKKEKIEKVEKVENKDFKIIINLILNEIKKKKYPIIDTYAIKLIKNIKNKNIINKDSTFLTILISPQEYDKAFSIFINIINKKINKNKYILKIINRENDIYGTKDILKERKKIIIINKLTNEKYTILSLIKIIGDCYSYQKKNGYNIGSIDTILCFLYSYNLIYKIYNKISNKKFIYNFDKKINESNKIISIFENYIKNIKVQNRLKTDCYGEQYGKAEAYKKNWKKKLSILHY